MGDVFAHLEAQYCPPLDPALLSAILSDYDLGDDTSLRNAQATLDELKESALLEEAAGFDPSGTGATENGGQGKAESCPDTSASQSRETDLTSLSNDTLGLNLEDDTEGYSSKLENLDHAEHLEGLDDATKIQLLQDLFGEHVSQYTIKHTLKKCDGKWNTAMEELLSHVYFGKVEDDGFGFTTGAKSIDAFAEEGIVRRGRKKKSKAKRVKTIGERRSSSLPELPNGSTASQTNKWRSATEDIEFIASRTGIATATVSSMYYTEGASVPRTLAALLKASMEESKHLVDDEASIFAEARALAPEYPTLALNYLSAIVRLTHPSTTTARELAQALTAKSKHATGGGICIIPHYAAPDVDAVAEWNTVAKNVRSPAVLNTASPGSASAANRRDAYTLARAAAYSQASAAHRKARSDRLMGGAAAYYGQVGRDYAALSSSASAAAADELAASQSTRSQLDLHGIDVANAVRIAQEKVEAWWDNLGESRVNGRIGAEDRQTGYRIVVGLGRHSEGGKSKLGPAVTKMLRQEDWRIETTGAVIVVKGRIRR